MTTVDVPGIYLAMTGAEYLADPVKGGSLSSTGARKLLAPGCPAAFRHFQLNPAEPTRTFNLGHAAHRQALGRGAELVDIQGATNYRTKDAQAQQDAAYDAGNIPVLPKERVQVDAMAEVLRSHRYASLLLSGGRAEQCIVWVDEATGVWCRAMLDYVTTGLERPVVVDYKTCDHADLGSIRRSLARYGYFQQNAWYLEGAEATGLVDADPAFAFIFQEREAPYIVTVVSLDPEDVEAGHRRNRRAREVYRDCMASGVWPEYTLDIETVRLPRWVREMGEDF